MTQKEAVGRVLLVLLLGAVVALVAAQQSSATISSCFIPHTSAAVEYTGRVLEFTGGVQFDWSAVQVHVNVSRTTAVYVHLHDTGHNKFNVLINGALSRVLATSKNQTIYKIADNLYKTRDYTITLWKRTEAYVGLITFTGFSIDSDLCQETKCGLELQVRASQRRLEFIGASISCGYGALGKPPCDGIAYEDSAVAYGAVISRTLKAEVHFECWAGLGVVRNAGDSSPTSKYPFPAFYPRTVAVNASIIWPARSWIPNAVVINLGTNDFSGHPTPTPEVFETGFVRFVDNIRGNYSQPNLPVFLACGPMLTGEVCQYVENVVKRMGNPTYYLDFVNIIGNNHGCAGHPNTEAHMIMADKATPIIRQILHW